MSSPVYASMCAASSSERALRACWCPEGTARCRACPARARDGSAGGRRWVSVRVRMYLAGLALLCSGTTRLYKRTVYAYDVMGESLTQKDVF